MSEKLPQNEVIISSNSAKGSANWSMEDVETGSVLVGAKAGQSTDKTLCLVGRDYLVSAVPGSPVINVWHLAYSRQAKKMVVPGIVTALAVSRQGHYLVAAIENKLHLWQVCTGNLLRVLHGHIQGVNCIKFTSDGIYFISGGNDGVTLVWTLSSVLCSEIGSKEIKGSDVIKPTFSWKNHTLPIQDIYVGYFGYKGRVATCSSDSTCKIYELTHGSLVLSVFMDVELFSVTMDAAERFLFLGDQTGNIHCITLAYHGESDEIHYDSQNEKLFQVFRGHSAEVVCLSVSVDGQLLLSGSNDCCLKLWNILSQTCVKNIQCEGPVTNAFLVRTPPVIRYFRDKRYEKPAFEFATLKRHLHKDDEENADGDMHKNVVCLDLQNQQLKTWDLSSGMDILEGITSAGESNSSKAELKGKIGSIKKTNEQMYYYLVDSFISTL